MVYSSKECKDCCKTKPLTEFYKNGKYYSSFCKPCHLALTRKSRAIRIADGRENETKRKCYNSKTKAERREIYKDGMSRAYMLHWFSVDPRAYFGHTSTTMWKRMAHWGNRFKNGKAHNPEMQEMYDKYGAPELVILGEFDSPQEASRMENLLYTSVPSHLLYNKTGVLHG